MTDSDAMTRAPYTLEMSTAELVADLEKRLARVEAWVEAKLLREAQYRALRDYPEPDPED